MVNLSGFYVAVVFLWGLRLRVAVVRDALQNLKRAFIPSCHAQWTTALVKRLMIVDDSR